MNKEFSQNASKEGLNKLVRKLLEITNNRFQCNILENELREILDIKEEKYLFVLTVDYDWLETEYKNDKFKDLSESLYEEWFEINFK